MPTGRWVFEDETWWSRFAQPRLHVWSEADKPLHLVEQVKQKEDADPKALACYGVLMRWCRPEAAMQGSSLAALRGWSSGQRDHNPVPGMVLQQVVGVGFSGMGVDLGQRLVAS